MQIKFEEVSSTYNGQSGCMCGCLGKYYIACSADIEQHCKEAGWAAYDESNVSPRAMKIAITKINKVLATVDLDDADAVRDANLLINLVGDCKYVSLDDRSRNTTIYLK